LLGDGAAVGRLPFAGRSGAQVFSAAATLGSLVCMPLGPLGRDLTGSSGTP
jgi:hypothetical protein